MNAYDPPADAAALTTMVNAVAAVLPLPSVTVIVKVEVPAPLGVPEMTHVEELRPGTPVPAELRQIR